VKYLRRLFTRGAGVPARVPPPPLRLEELWLCLTCSALHHLPGPCRQCNSRYVQRLYHYLANLKGVAAHFRATNSKLRARQGLAPVPLPNFLTSPGSDNWTTGDKPDGSL